MDKIRTIGQLRKATESFSDDDLLVMETTDLKTGDAIDLFPFYVDEIPGIELEGGKVVSEVRFCQMDNREEKIRYYRFTVFFSRKKSFYMPFSAVSYGKLEEEELISLALRQDKISKETAIQIFGTDEITFEEYQDLQIKYSQFSLR